MARPPYEREAAVDKAAVAIVDDDVFWVWKGEPGVFSGFNSLSNSSGLSSRNALANACRPARSLAC
jgi:hypothetical protein